MDFMEMSQVPTICDLSTNQSISRWYAFTVFVFSIIIILVILVNVVINCCRVVKNPIHISDITASSYDYHPVD
jgi:hypothetical protein